ncbi:FecR family protein [Parachryseolinea silvisoli]|uniref:FecR family protein n=1 Tax=Parachryseolinea silvisoli TaxID=2873601 RepID=UPI0022658F96|nr:FecR domain-containing protein [Parachryseolinea silvisoli]MCD9017543.1 FecR domain-containing protein [Parachryseolinea silvisoli]
MSESEFSDLIRRYQSDTCTPQERALVEKWLENRTESNQSEKIPPQERKEILSDISIALFEKITAAREQQNTLTPWWRMAAVFALVAVSMYFLWHVAYRPSAAEPEILHASTSGNEVRKVMLADGTIIWLKGNSSVSYPNEFSGRERNVTLSGEALFEVAKDAAHPFIISSGEYKTTVLGTSFNLKVTPENVEVLVLTGKVAITSSRRTDRIIVMPNQKASFSGVNEQPEKAQVKIAEQQQVIDRTEYDMNFRDTRMDEVIKRIEKKFDVSTALQEGTLANCIITIDLTDQSLDRTLDMVSAILGFTYEINNKDISIRGDGCEAINNAYNLKP